MNNIDKIDFHEPWKADKVIKYVPSMCEVFS